MIAKRRVRARDATRLREILPNPVDGSTPGR